MTASMSSHNMVVNPYRSKVASERRPLSQRLNTIHETGDVYATVAQTKKHFSPPNLPPCWGQDVAPPPTPLFTPQTSPGNSNGKCIDTSNVNEHDIEIVDVPLRYATPSEIMEPEILEPLEQIRDYRSNYHTKQRNTQETIRRNKGSTNKSLHTRYQRTSTRLNLNPESNLSQNVHCNYRTIPGPKNDINFCNDQDEGDLVMVRSDDVITYSYRFGKSGEINRYPIDLVPQQKMHIRGSRTSLSNEMLSKKIRRRKKRRQRMLQNLSPDELVTIDEIPYLTNHPNDNYLCNPHNGHNPIETHGRGYFVGDTKIYDTNLNTMNNVNFHNEHYPKSSMTRASHFNQLQLYRNTLPRSKSSLRPPPNSQSNSPIYTGSSGTSPEATTQFPSNQPHPSSPVSPDSNITSQTTNVLIVNHCHVDRNEPHFQDTEDLERDVIRSIHSSSSTSSLTQTTIHKRRSSMKMASTSNIDRHPRKTVQWLVDTKKRPEDISQDRKVVKYQVKHGNKISLSFMRDLIKPLKIFPAKLFKLRAY